MSPPQIRSYRPLIGPLFLPSFFMALLLGISLPVLPLYLQYLGGSYLIIGTIISARPIGMLLAALPSGAILSRLSMRATMVTGCSLVILSLITLYGASNNVAIFLSWLFVGVGSVLYELARHQYIANYIDNQFRGRAVSIIGGLARLAAVLGPTIGGWTAQAYQFNTPFLVMAGCATITGLIALITVPNVPQTVAAEAASIRGYGVSLWQTMRDYRRLLLAAGGAQVLMQLIRRARTTIIPLFAANVLGLDVTLVGLVLSAGSILDTMMFWSAGLIMDKFGRKAAIVPSLVLRAIGFFLIPFTTGFWSIVAVAGLLGFSNGLSSGTMITLGADLAPKEQRIPFLGLWRVSSATGFALGPNAVGVVAEAFTLGPASLVIGVISLTAASVFWWFVPETLEKAQ
ncbi:MAG: MFS transporter [Chloroflexota bacterium]